MIMWLFIFIAMFIAMIVGIGVIIEKLRKTSIIRKIAGERKGRQRIITTVIVVLLLAASYFLFGMINMAVILVQILCICVLMDFVLWVVKKGFHKTFNRDIVVCTGIILLILYFGFGWYEAHHIIATRYQVETQKAVEPLHLVQITDSHLGATFDGEGFAQAIERIQSENPDVVVITGDFVDDDSSREDMMRSCEALKTLETKYGVYFVFGNHDKGYYNNERRGYDADDLILELEKNGVTVLQDEKVLLGDSYELIGRQDRSEEDFGRTRASMEELVSESNPEKYQIVLDHQPNDFENQEKTGVDLVLSGHTHGGQFFPINRLGEWFGLNDMTYGIRKNGNTTFEVSSGISDWAIKFKTGCKAEYVVIDIA